MSVLVVRHALSEANNRNNVGTLAFASMEAPLMVQGIEQSIILGRTLLDEYEVNPAITIAATSELTRTQETAQRSGFLALKCYRILNEVSHGIVLPHLRGLLDQQILPNEVLTAARRILDQPPAEKIWITHGLVIAGLCKILDSHQDKRLIPKFCEIRKIDF